MCTGLHTDLAHHSQDSVLALDDDSHAVGDVVAGQHRDANAQVDLGGFRRDCTQTRTNLHRVTELASFPGSPHEHSRK